MDSENAPRVLHLAVTDVESSFLSRQDKCFQFSLESPKSWNEILGESASSMIVWQLS